MSCSPGPGWGAWEKLQTVDNTGLATHSWRARDPKEGLYGGVCHVLRDEFPTMELIATRSTPWVADLPYVVPCDKLVKPRSDRPFRGHTIRAIAEARG